MNRGRAVLAVLALAGLFVSGWASSVPPGGTPGLAPVPHGLLPAAGPGSTYTVTFTESGLPSGTSWTITLNGTAHSATSSTITFSASNGTYNYTVSNVPGWRANAYSGSVAVNGAATGVSVSWSQTAYAVTFTETGLPSGTAWTVTLGGLLVSSSGTSLSFAEPNGTYNYSVANVPGWRASSYAGAVSVIGAAVAVTIAWAQTTYSVTFTESGLPLGTSWAVTLAGIRGTSTTNAIAFAEPNGTYSYNVSSVLGWRSSPTAGSVTVNGLAVTINVSWTRVTYTVTFTETGLPSGTNWSVTLGGTLAYSTTAAIVVAKSNGSYAYSVGAISGYSVAPSGATVTVAGASLSSAVTFSAVSGATFAVTFTESGLAAGAAWGVTLGGVPAVSTGTSIAYLEPNGAIAYTVANVPGWRANAYSGSVTVNGAAASVTVAWVRLAYTVSFTETGLPTGTGWGISLNGVLLSSTSGSIAFAEPNGTYGYAVASVSGWRATSYTGVVTVNGGPTAVTVAWAQFAYSVAVRETGLPSGTAWGVTLNGTLVTSSNSTIAFAMPNGTFPYVLSHVAGWRPSSGSGSLTVNGRPVSLTVTFAPVTYAVTFTESGLPSGTSWSVTLAGAKSTTTNASIAFAEPNGTFNYTVAGVSGYRSTSYAGSVGVNGSATTLALAWSRATFSVTFGESGLPSGTSWSVTLGGVLARSSTSTIAFPEPNGTYAYRVTNVSGWRSSAASGSVTVSGASVSIGLSWSEVTYAVTFTSSGLPSGTSWKVALNGSATTSTSTSISFAEPNGTFAYNVSSAGWRATTPTGSVTVSGGPAALTVSWTAVTYNVSFNETGLPAATSWGVTLNGTLHTATSAVIAFAEPNGTYNYTVSPILGWTASPRTGSVTVAGKAATVGVSWSKTTYAVTFTEFGLNTGTTWSVTLGGTVGSSSGTTITFAEPNGSYTYLVAGLAGWQANAYSGSVTVAGKAASVTVTWNQMSYTLTFVESGLPSGTSWTVSVGGVLATSTGSLNSIGVPNGTYSYTVLGLSGWRASSYGGTVTVSGQAASVTITWTQLTYPVTFTESGLPSGTSWSVTLSGTQRSASGPSITFAEPNGSYAYVVSVLAGFTPGSSAGSVAVAGGSAGVAVAWTVVTYTVTFTQSGLPANASWAVALGGTEQVTSNRSISFVEPNGTFNYSIPGEPGFRTIDYRGQVTVAGGSLVLTVPWTTATYPVTFTATGLPAGTSWSVTLRGTVASSTSDAIGFEEPNGTFPFSIASVSGWHTSPYAGTVTVSSGPAGVVVAWIQVTYPITFTETGLPAGTSWTVTIGGTAASSTGTTISIDEPNGSYSYTVSTVRGYSLPSSSGSVTVTVGPVAQPIAFRTTPGSSTLLGVSGPAGMAWLATAFAAIATALILLVLLLRARRKGDGAQEEALEAPASGEAAEAAEPEPTGGSSDALPAEPEAPLAEPLPPEPPAEEAPAESEGSPAAGETGEPYVPTSDGREP